MLAELANVSKAASQRLALHAIQFGEEILRGDVNRRARNYQFATAIRFQIEMALAQRIPSALTPRRKAIRMRRWEWPIAAHRFATEVYSTGLERKYK